jgi:hypothetical protein
MRRLLVILAVSFLLLAPISTVVLTAVLTLILLGACLIVCPIIYLAIEAVSLVVYRK